MIQVGLERDEYGLHVHCPVCSNRHDLQYSEFRSNYGDGFNQNGFVVSCWNSFCNNAYAVAAPDREEFEVGLIHEQ